MGRYLSRYLPLQTAVPHRHFIGGMQLIIKIGNVLFVSPRP
ncbi:hypothetical protein AVEN_113422-1, partial [Araneus ventricosus]